MSKQVTTITIFRFEGLQAYWIFSQMGLAIPGFKKVKGLEFFKLMGSGGKNGFSKMLNVNVYALLCVWESESAAASYFNSSAHFLEFKDRSKEVWTVYMKNKKAHGKWSGAAPFRDFEPYSGGMIAVITRARIKLKYVRKFWSYVPTVSGNLDDQEKLIFSIGIGEYPWLMQATFSIWEDQEAIQAYAYQSKLHMEVVKKTRELGWYQEEMFANFIPYKSTGSWEGNNPLAKFL